MQRAGHMAIIGHKCLLENKKVGVRLNANCT
jgi:hypothetical protein